MKIIQPFYFYESDALEVVRRRKLLKRIETNVENILLILFIYSFLIIWLFFANYFEASQIFLFLKKINPLLVLVGLIVSSLAVPLFPLWNIYDEYRELDVEKIINLEHRYKRNYKRLFSLFLIMTILSKSVVALDLYFIFGYFSLLIYLFFIFFKKKIKKVLVIKKKKTYPFSRFKLID